MRLDQAIIATDHAPHYVEAACLAAAGWRRLGVDCVVGFVGEAIPPLLDYKRALAQFRYAYTYNRYTSWTALVSDVVDVRSWFRGQLADAPGLVTSRRPHLPGRFGWIAPRPRELIDVARRAARRLIGVGR